MFYSTTSVNITPFLSSRRLGNSSISLHFSLVGDLEILSTNVEKLKSSGRLSQLQKDCFSAKI